MTCAEVREAFSGLYDGVLPAPTLTEVRQHLAGCFVCEHEWQMFQSTVDEIRGFGTEEPSAGFTGRVMARIQAPRWWERAARRLVFPLPVKLPLHAAALVLVSLVGVWLFQRSPDVVQVPERRTPPPVTQAEAPRPAAPAVVPHPPKPSGLGEPRKLEAPTVSRKAGPTVSAESAGESPPAAPSPPSMASAPALDQSGPPPSYLPRREEDQAVKREGLAAKAAPRGAAAPADELLSEMQAALAASKYDEAGERLRAFLIAYPDDPRAGALRFWLAEAYRAKGAYAEAGREYEDFLKRYPADEKAPAATYGLGEARLRSHESKGCETLRGALRSYPDLPQAPAARHLVESRCP